MARTGMFATLVCLALAATAEAQMMMAPPTTGTSTGRTGLFGRRNRNVQPATSYYATPGMTMGTYGSYGTIQPTMGTTYGAGSIVYGTPGTVVGGSAIPGTVVYGSGTPGTIIGSGTPGSVVYGGTPGTVINGGIIPGTIINGTTVTPGTIVYGGTPGTIIGSNGMPMTTTPGIYSNPVAGTYNPAMAGTTMTQPGYNTYRTRLMGRRSGTTTPYAMGTPVPGTYVYPR